MSDVPTYRLADLPLPSLPETEGWVFGLLLGLFALLVLAHCAYPGLIGETLGSLVRTKERDSLFSNPEGSDPRLRVLYLVFALGTLSLCAYVLVFTPGRGAFAPAVYGRVLLLVSLFFLVKEGLIRVLCYTFFDRRVRQVALRSYYDLTVFASLAAYPLLVVRIYAGEPLVRAAGVVVGIVGISVVILIVLKLFQIFFAKSLDFLYILLYLCTLEVLPFLALVQACRLIV